MGAWQSLSQFVPVVDRTGRVLGRRGYAWAALIEDSVMLAIDYAPDAGWLDPRPEAHP
jgi:hypothetical protein